MTVTHAGVSVCESAVGTNRAQEPRTYQPVLISMDLVQQQRSHDSAVNTYSQRD